MMIEPLYSLSWALFFVAALAIIYGGIIVYKHGQNKGLYYTMTGFIGLGLSGLMMTIACGIP